MAPLVDFLRDWKELVGAVIGGLFSLLVALVVARQVRRAEEQTAATLLITEFLRVHAMVDAATEPPDSVVAPQDRASALVERICRFRVRLSPLFDAAIARVAHVDVYLAGTMHLAASFIRDTEPVVERLALDVEALHRDEQLKRSQEAVQADVQVVAGGYELIAKHSKHSARLLQELVLSPFPSRVRLRRWIRPSKEDLDLLQLLKRGAA